MYYRDHGTHLPYYGNGGQICARYGDRSTESLMRLCTVSRVKGGCDKTGRPICVASPSRLNLTCGIQPSCPRPKVMLSCQFRLSLLLSDRVPKGILASLSDITVCYWHEAPWISTPIPRSSKHSLRQDFLASNSPGTAKVSQKRK